MKRRKYSISEKTASNKVRYSADNAKNETIKFKPFKLGELFKSQTGDVDLQQNGTVINLGGNTSAGYDMIQVLDYQQGVFHPCQYHHIHLY